MWSGIDSWSYSSRWGNICRNTISRCIVSTRSDWRYWNAVVNTFIGSWKRSFATWAFRNASTMTIVTSRNMRSWITTSWRKTRNISSYMCSSGVTWSTPMMTSGYVCSCGITGSTPMMTSSYMRSSRITRSTPIVASSFLCSCGVTGMDRNWSRFTFMNASTRSRESRFVNVNWTPKSSACYSSCGIWTARCGKRTSSAWYWRYRICRFIIMNASRRSRKWSLATRFFVISGVTMSSVISSATKTTTCSKSSVSSIITTRFSRIISRSWWFAKSRTRTISRSCGFNLTGGSSWIRRNWNITSTWFIVTSSRASCSSFIATRAGSTSSY